MHKDSFIDHITPFCRTTSFTLPQDPSTRPRHATRSDRPRKLRTSAGHCQLNSSRASDDRHHPTSYCRRTRNAGSRCIFWCSARHVRTVQSRNEGPVIDSQFTPHRVSAFGEYSRVLVPSPSYSEDVLKAPSNLDTIASEIDEGMSRLAQVVVELNNPH